MHRCAILLSVSYRTVVRLIQQMLPDQYTKLVWSKLPMTVVGVT